MDFNFTNSGLHVVCLNIHHILPKIDEIKYVLYNSDIHILGLIETFLNAEILDNDIQIPNYNIIRRDRNNRKGGGILIYIKDNIPFQHRLDLNVNFLESVWIEIMFPQTKSFLINFVYRPPDSTIEWISTYESNFKNANNLMDTEFYILGDFNINFLSDKDVFSNNKWSSFVMANGLQQMVRQPTRITKTSNTIIDHLYTNRPDRIMEMFVSSYSISDHFPVCFTRKTRYKLSKNTHLTKEYRQFKNFNESNFQNYLLMSNVEHVETIADPNTSLSYLLNKINEALSVHAP